MTERAIYVLTVLAAVGSGVMGGLMFAFSTAVMAALARIVPAGGIAAMQAVNIVILNPLFLVAFLGPALLSVGLAGAALLGWPVGSPIAIYVGAALYLIGIIGVTMVFNVPMNDALAAVDPSSGEGAAVWANYLANWTRWNHIRALSGVTACAAFILALR